MAGTTHNEMQCSEFEALLNDALDSPGALDVKVLHRFQAHRQSCALCSVMFAEAEAGKAWLLELDEVDPPRHLVHNILAATTGRQSARVPELEDASWVERVRGWVMPVLRPVMQPRFAMSLAMAFFSFSIMMNLAGVRLRDVRYLDLRPSAVRDNTVRTFYETTGRLESYYMNLRWVYEIESRARELKNAATPAENPEPPKDQEKRDPNNTSGQPERQKNERYSLQFVEPAWAMISSPGFGATPAMNRSNG